MNFRNSLLVILLGMQIHRVSAQCSSPGFQLPSTGCLSQTITVTPDVILPNLQWDFCAGDLDGIPTASVFNGTAGAAFNVALIEQGGKYYGFYVSRSSNKLYRLDFGTDVTSTPAAVDLGGLGLSSVAWLSIQIVKEGNQYYGFIIDYFNKLYRFTIGSDIAGAPSSAEILYQNGLLANPISLTVIQDETGKYAFIANSGSNNLTRFSFGSSFGNLIGSITLDNVVITGSGSLSGVSLIRECNLWYAVTTSIGGGQIDRILFTSGLGDPTPVISSIGLSFTPSSPGGVALAFENSKYYAFIQSYPSSHLSKIDFGSSMANVPLSDSGDLGDLGILTNVWGFSMYKVNSDWLVLASDNTGPNMYRIKFPNNCMSAKTYSTVSGNTLTVANTGTFSIQLSSTDALGRISSVSKSIVISNNTAPDIVFSSLNNCVNNNVNFTSDNSSGNISSYSWNFGDGTGTSGDSNPDYAYSSPNKYLVSLNVTASNGCSNSTQDSLQIFNSAQADFSLPTMSPICSNQNYVFTNTSTADIGSNPTWQWIVNGADVAVTQDLNYLIPSATAQSITLIASIPGCSTQITKALSTVEAGPLVTFNSPATGCLNASEAFSNTTAGSITSLSWAFGDGNSSSQSPISNTYTGTGTYPVTLTTTNVAGCQNSLTRNIVIYSNPVADFSLGLPPFSCSASPSQFTDVTPTPTDSNLSSWVWSFGDASNDTSAQRNPLFTYSIAGTYSVGLKVTSNFGCADSVRKTITIAQSPVVDFTNTPACVDQGTQFTDSSTGSIKSWLWQIGTSSYSSQSFSHAFNAPASYGVQLTVTDNNGCIAQTTKTVNVPVSQSPDFSALSTCATKTTIFQSNTPGSTDPIISYSWDFAGQGPGSGSPAQFIFPATGNFSVKMDALAQSGCVYSVTKTIVIVAPPVASFTTSTDAGGAPLKVQFTNTSVNATSYLWHFNDQSDSVTTSASPSFIFTNLGDYLVDLDATNDQGCVDTFSKTLHAVVPNIDAAITGLQFVRDPSSGQVKALFVIDNFGNLPLTNPTIVVEISGNATLSQNLNLTVMPGQNTSQVLNYSFLTAGIQYVCVRVETSQDVNLNNDKDCATFNEQSFVFSPYPNPVRGELHFDWIATSEGDAHIAIVNTTGGKVFERQFDSVQSGLNQIQLDVSNLAQGIYIMIFTCSGAEKRFRFIVN